MFVERHGLEENEIPKDLGQSVGDLVVLSFSDSDLGTFAEAWHQPLLARDDFPTLRLANLAALKHPVSVDTYIEKTLSAAGILVRLIGGTPYWSYGLQQVEKLARKNKIAFAVIPADGRDDLQLDAVSTLPVSTLRQLRHLCEIGGVVAAQATGPASPGSRALCGAGHWLKTNWLCWGLDSGTSDLLPADSKGT